MVGIHNQQYCLESVWKRDMRMTWAKKNNLNREDDDKPSGVAIFQANPRMRYEVA